MSLFQQHKGYTRMYREGRMTLGFLLPIESYPGDTPTMEHQVDLARRAEALGFAALWLRDVTLHDLSFGDVGQIYDLWVYLTYIAAHTKDIGMGTASVVLPLRHPLRVAKEAASIDRLFPERLIMGVSSGDRLKDFAALGAVHEERGQRFRQAYRYLNEVLYGDSPPLPDGARFIPKPAARIPTMITGYSQQTMEWFAEHGDGWIYYPRSIKLQQHTVSRWRELIEQRQPGRFKPFSQTLYLDLVENPNGAPEPIHLGFRVGRNALREILSEYESIGVNHLAFVLFMGKRPAADVFEELGQEILPHFPTHIPDSSGNGAKIRPEEDLRL